MFEAWSLRQASVQQQEERIRQRVQRLSDPQRRHFYQTYQQRLKDPDTYAALNWCCVAGLHNFYLGQWLAGLFDLSLMLLGILCLFFAPLIGIGLLVLVTVIELPALFRSQIIIAHVNNQTALAILRSEFADHSVTSD